jgi:hypothetical protein
LVSVRGRRAGSLTRIATIATEQTTHTSAETMSKSLTAPIVASCATIGTASGAGADNRRRAETGRRHRLAHDTSRCYQQ